MYELLSIPITNELIKQKERRESPILKLKIVKSIQYKFMSLNLLQSLKSA